MKKQYILLIIIFLIPYIAYSQSTYSGNASVTTEDFFIGFPKDSDKYYLGGCNAFPIGTFVNVKLPYTDDTVFVKIVTRIPEDGIFILIEKEAGSKLGLEVGDVLPVRVQVKKFTPPPLEELDIVEELDPEPEIKGLTSESLAETTPEDMLPEETIPVEEDPASEEDVLLEEDLYDDSDIVEESGITEESEVFEDELPEESMFTTLDDETEPVEKVEKKVKRIYFLEPADKKPPVGGIPDSELIAVTTVEDKIFKNGYYLQVGIYREKESIKLDTQKIEQLNFPHITVKENGVQQRQRLLVGPVSNDELGVIMLTLKSRGFKDFFRYRNKTND